MTEITYIVNHPVKLSDHFDIPMDQSKWDGISYEKKGDNTVPVRDRIIHFKNLLIPKTNYAQQYCTSGLYLMFFNDFKKYYVGIACKLAKGPEGILTRISKHRTKATATYHQGGKSVNHTEQKPYGWQSLAKARFKKYGNKDKLDDCYLVTLSPKDYNNIKDYEDETKKFCYLEKELSQNTNKEFNSLLKNIPGSGVSNEWNSINKQDNGTEHKYKFVSN
jgi:hypothetical protein